MSSFKADFKNKNGDIVEVWCIDDYFGKHIYGYVFPDKKVLSYDDLLREGWERIIGI
jgi:hypothetical protein